MNLENSPLNINLIIPFKDNKGGRLNLYKIEMDRFNIDLSSRADELKAHVAICFGDSFELTIAARSDGYTKKYYWRFKSSVRDRKFSRLCSHSLIEYLGEIPNHHLIRLKEVEKELIYINANLKALKGLNDSMSQCAEELTGLAGVNI